MSTNELPEGLELAVDVLLEESARNVLIGAPESWNEELGAAIDAIRAEHAQRLTLQHHAADQAQRIADLETKCVTLKRLHDAAADERDALAQQHRSQHDADSAELRQLCADRDAARKERDALLEAEHRISSAYVDLRAILGAMSPPSTDWPVLSQYVATVASDVVNERDALREKYDELLVALHGIGRALGLADGDRSPYSVTCGVLERVNRLAEIEAQEPVATVETSGSQGAGIGWSGAAQPVGAKLYARPVPAQAAPDADAADAAIDAAMAAAPEHKA